MGNEDKAGFFARVGGRLSELGSAVELGGTSRTGGFREIRVKLAERKVQRVAVHWQILVVPCLCRPILN